MKAVSDEEKEWVRVARALMSTQEAPGWRECVRHVMPELLGAGDLEGLPDDGLPQAVCERAVTGVLKLASAHSVMITPRGLNWFSYDAGDEGGEERSGCATHMGNTLVQLHRLHFCAEVLYHSICYGASLMYRAMVLCRSTSLKGELRRRKSVARSTDEGNDTKTP